MVWKFRLSTSIEEIHNEGYELKIIEFVNKLSNLENLYFIREFQPFQYVFQFRYLKSLTLSNVRNLSELSSLPMLHTLHIEYFNLDNSPNLYKFQQIETLILGSTDIERRIKKIQPIIAYYGTRHASEIRNVNVLQNIIKHEIFNVQQYYPNTRKLDLELTINVLHEELFSHLSVLSYLIIGRGVRFYDLLGG